MARRRMRRTGRCSIEFVDAGCGRVSDVLSRKRPLSLRMVKRLHEGLKIPYESLLAGVR